MFQRLLRVIYVIEFLLALLTVFTFWSEVGGQAHLDLMAWWWKGGLGLLSAYAIVRITVALAGEGSGHRRQLFAWSGLLAVLVIAGGLVTYYYHLNEPIEEDTTEDGAPTQTRLYLHAIPTDSADRA